MDTRIKIAFLVMLILQAIHSAEEVIFKFHEAFPPMKFLYGQFHSLAQTAFVLFNSLLILFGLFCFFYWVRPAKAGARNALCLWVGIQLATIAAHAVWLILTNGYHPGLVTAPLLMPAAAYMIYRLVRISSRPPPNNSFNPTPNAKAP